MQERIEKFLNETTKSTWVRRNYFFLTTISVVTINVLLFLIGGNDWTPPLKIGKWNDVLNFHNLSVHFLNNFEHANLQHCLLNSLCFLVVGVYLERKQGSIPFFVLTILFCLIGSFGVAANYSYSFHGFSGTNYCLYAYVIVDFIFILAKKDTRTKPHLIYGGIMLALIYIATCFCGGTSGFAFKVYPYDLITNMGHYTSFFIGLIFSLPIKIFPLLNQER